MDPRDASDKKKEREETSNLSKQELENRCMSGNIVEGEKKLVKKVQQSTLLGHNGFIKLRRGIREYFFCTHFFREIITLTHPCYRLSGQKQSFAKKLLMEQKKMEALEKLKQKQAESGSPSPQIGRGFETGVGNAFFYLRKNIGTIILKLPPYTPARFDLTTLRIQYYDYELQC
jgi:hypothetical protein